MPPQVSSTSPARRVLDRIVEERFTGLLRVSSHEASGEFWFLVGILEEARFGVSKGEEAMERLLRATQAVFQAELRLPYVSGGFKKPMPVSGTFAEFRPVVLMRHCESYALTCSLELRGKDRTVHLTYRMGELLSADAAAAGNDALPALLESQEGSYEFLLPTFELPDGVNAPVAASASKLPLAERIDRLLADESAAEAERKMLEAVPAKDETLKADVAAEAKRKAELAAQAEAQRKAELAAAADAKRKAEQVAAADAQRKAELAAQAEAQRKAELAAQAEAQRKAELAAAADAKRQAEQAAQAEAERKLEAERKIEADVAQAKREGEEREAAAAKAEAEAKRTKAREPARDAEPARDPEPALAESSPESDEQAEVVPRKREFPFWLFLLLLLGGLAYFIKQRLGR